MNILMITGICFPAGVLIYLWMIKPKRKTAGPQNTELFGKCFFAHRGLHDNAADAPENSLRAFERAVRAGYGAELDVQLTRDNIPVIFHDFTLERICGVRGKVEQYSYEELQHFALCDSDQRIPKLEEVLRLVNGSIPLIVELKTAGPNIRVCREADRLLAAYQGEYCIESFNPLVLCWYRRNRKEVIRGQLSDAFLKEEYAGPLYFLLQNLLLNWLGKPDFIAYNCKYPQILSRRLCRSLYHNTAVAWTVRSKGELEEAEKHFDIFIFDSFLPEIQQDS